MSTIELLIYRENLEKYFLVTPNALFRGEAMYAGLSPRARCLLGALLTNSNGHKINRQKIEQYLGLGKAATDAVIKELKDGRFLTTTPGHGPRGRFVWVWAVRQYPEGMTQTQAMAMFEAISAGGTMGGFSTDGQDAEGQAEDVSAGGTEGRFSTDGDTGTNRTGDVSAGRTNGDPPDYGRPGVGEPPSVNRPPIEETGFEKEQNLPPNPPSPAAAAVDGQAATEEGAEDPSEPEDPVEAVVAQAMVHKPGWRPASIRAVITQALEEGRSPEIVPAAMLAVAADPASRLPQRLLQDGPWWAATVRPATGSRRVGPRCHRHPDQLADGCRLCDEEAAEAPQADPPLAAATAAELVRQKAAAGAAAIKAAANRRRGAQVEPTVPGVSVVAQRAGEPTSPATAAAG